MLHIWHLLQFTLQKKKRSHIFEVYKKSLKVQHNFAFSGEVRHDVLRHKVQTMFEIRFLCI